MAQNPRTTTRDTNTQPVRNPRLTRRSYVRSLAAVAVGSASAMAATGSGAATSTVGEPTGATDEYETISLSEGEDRTITVESGEAFENVLVDCTPTGARVTIVAHGTDWTIRNVAIDGELDVGRPAAVFGVSDTGGNTSTFENVYLGDGSHNAGDATAETGIWVNPEHNGHIDFKHVNVQGFPDNGLYASAPAGAGGGTVHVDECFAADNYVANVRIGSEGSKVTNSSIYCGDDGYDGRGVWVWSPGPCEIENCQLEMNSNHFSIWAGANNAGSTVSVAESDYDTGFEGGIENRFGSAVDLDDDVGTSPEATIPSGVPTSAEDAVTE